MERKCEEIVWSVYKANTLPSSRQPSNLITSSSRLLSRSKNKVKINIKRTWRPLCFVSQETLTQHCRHYTWQVWQLPRQVASCALKGTNWPRVKCGAFHDRKIYIYIYMSFTYKSNCEIEQIISALMDMARIQELHCSNLTLSRLV
jgi:hypothetical protein